MSDTTTMAPIVEPATTPAPTPAATPAATTKAGEASVTTTALGMVSDCAARVGKNMGNPIFLLLLVALFVLFIMLVNNDDKKGASKFLSDSTDGIKYLLTSTPN
jgi:hypothetical protein